MVNPRITRREWRNVILFALLIIVLTLLCFVTFPVNAQDTKTQELLYRSGDALHLANITAGTTIELPDIQISDSDRLYWSPNGRYLLNKHFIKDQGLELRVYDVDNQKWLNNFRQQAGFNAAWSYDGNQIAYTTSIRYDSLQQDGQLWVVDLKTATPRLLYQTKIIGDRALTDTGVGNIWWSPDNQFLLFEEYVYNFGFGHTDNGLKMISSDGKTIKNMVSPWRGGFNPIWSPNSKWFLLDMPDTLYFPTDSDDKGDVILYGINYEIYGSSHDIYGLTNTPDTLEWNLRWSSDSRQIQFEANKQLITIELQDVINNPTSFEQHLSPLPKEPKHFGDADFPSPDGKWIAYLVGQSDNTIDLYTVRLDGSHDSKLAESVAFYGWRPSK